MITTIKARVGKAEWVLAKVEKAEFDVLGPVNGFPAYWRPVEPDEDGYDPERPYKLWPRPPLNVEIIAS